MNPGQLGAWLTAHRTEALGVGAAAVAGLALYRRKHSPAAGGSGVTAGAVAPGTIPAASVVGATADSSAFDAYNALQDEIGTLARNSEAARDTGATGSGVGAAVGAPIASTLLAPTYSGNYWQMGQGIGEIESDGSLFVYNPAQWAAAQQKAPGIVSNVGGPGLDWYSTGSNVAHTVAGSTKPDPATSGA